MGWDGPPMERLWRYNQHYFDDLNAFGAEKRRAWHLELMRRWIKENPPAKAVGWEPYPTALRIVNWIKWALGGEVLPEDCIWSLAVQARWLARRLEFHLQGNHLLAEAKALIFAGLFFQGNEAEKWLLSGVKIWREQLQEQILEDGGHFERSPMYHSLVLEDLLDMKNLLGTFGPPKHGLEVQAKLLEQSCTSMRRWLALMCHPDGEIAFFNDAALGVACSPGELEAYAHRLGLPTMERPGEGVFPLEKSGYIRWAEKGALAILDVGPIGPDYIPGHAHADTLSFELSVGSRRFLVNSGTSCYGSGPERQRQRGTAAHNTVVLDSMDSSEVWSGFRVARRAKPVGLRVEEGKNPGGLTVLCGHDGYRRLPGRPLHQRKWTFWRGGLRVEDGILGPHREAEARFHFHPDWNLDLEEGGCRGRAYGQGGVQVLWEVEKGLCRVIESTYHPRFGESLPNKCLVVALEKGTSSVRFSWA